MKNWLNSLIKVVAIMYNLIKKAFKTRVRMPYDSRFFCANERYDMFFGIKSKNGFINCIRHVVFQFSYVLFQRTEYFSETFHKLNPENKQIESLFE